MIDISFLQLLDLPDKCVDILFCPCDQADDSHQLHGNINSGNSLRSLFPVAQDTLQGPAVFIFIGQIGHCHQFLPSETFLFIRR